MRFALACYGSRGDVEPCVAVGRELLRRGHDVEMAVPPDLMRLVEAAGPSAVAFGPPVQPILDAHRDFWACFFGSFWRIGDLIKFRRQVAEPVLQRWDDICATLMSVADGADLLLSGLNFEQPAANVAEHYGIPLATLHIFPHRANGQFLRFLPAPVGRAAMTLYEWAAWRAGKRLEDPQRAELGLPKAGAPVPKRIAERGSLEIQAYDQVCFPGLAEEWAQHEGQRLFVGALALELPTEVDDEVASWIAAGKPPIFFGFGSIPVQSPADTFAMIIQACTRLGERALICAAGTDFGDVPQADHVKIVGTMNYAQAFPACRAVVHHGGVGTTAASLRAGVPTLILSTDIDQTMWGARVKRLKVGTARRLSTTTLESLVADLRIVLDPQYEIRAREVAAQITKPADSVAAAADRLEEFARLSLRK